MIYYFTTTLVLFTIKKNYFYFPKCDNFLTELFCMHISYKYLPIYFNAITFEDIDV
jgi:hypothetical protein